MKHLLAVLLCCFLYIAVTMQAPIVPKQKGGAHSSIQRTTAFSPYHAAPRTTTHTVPADYTVVHAPTITIDHINAILVQASSPAIGTGSALYALGLYYGIDPIFALAFFQHESSLGKYGEARSSLSLGNLRCIPHFLCRDGYAWFPSWQAGYEAWYKLIRDLYVGYWHLTTVAEIIPRYAPATDNNDEVAYIASVEHSIDGWR